MNSTPPLSDSPAYPAPERSHLRIGYVALIDSAPLIAAGEMQFGRRHGLTLELCRQPSWAAIRDKLLSGELDAAQTLYGMVYGVQLGLGGPQADMAILMTLNRNGQAITVSNQLAEKLRAGQPLQAALGSLDRKPVFAQTFPTGTHAMWLNYWLAAHGVHPLADIDSVVIPPPQMPEALAQGELDGFCAGEPWHAVAQNNQSGKTVISTSQIWPDHPEKALACRREFAALYPNTTQALIRTMLESCQWLADNDNKLTLSAWLARPEYLNIAQDLILSRMGTENIEATQPATPPLLPVRFFDRRGANYPLPADGLWFLGQFHRWGLSRATDQWHDIVNQVCQTEHYAAAALQIGLDAAPPAASAVRFFDGKIWDGSDVIHYAESFAIRA